MADKLRSPFTAMMGKVPSATASKGVSDKVPYEGVDHPGSSDIPLKNFEDVNPETAPGSKANYKAPVVRSPFNNGIAK